MFYYFPISKNVEKCQQMSNILAILSKLVLNKGRPFPKLACLVVANGLFYVEDTQLCIDRNPIFSDLCNICRMQSYDCMQASKLWKRPPFIKYQVTEYCQNI